MLHLNQEKLQEVFQAFYTATGARVAIMDRDRKEVASYPQRMCKFCTMLRENPKVDKLCQASDEKAFAMCQETGETYAYECDMGLFEAVSPIYIGGQLEGYIMMGQVPATTGRWEVLRRAMKYVEDIEPLERELENLTTAPYDRLSSIAYLMNVCVEYLCSAKYIAPADNGRAKKIDRYILDHIHLNLKAEDLCQAFHISRTSLHYIVKQAYDMSLSQRIQHLKIEKAKELLAQKVDSFTICDCLGYSDRTQFYKTFKRVTGKSLRDYNFDRK